MTARTAAEGGRADPIIHCGICLANSRRASTRRREGKGEPGGEVNGTNYRGPCRTGAMGGWRQTQHNSATQQRIISHSDHLRPPQFSRARRGASGSELLFRRIRGRGPRAGAAGRRGGHLISTMPRQINTDEQKTALTGGLAIPRCAPPIKVGRSWPWVTHPPAAKHF